MKTFQISRKFFSPTLQYFSEFCSFQSCISWRRSARWALTWNPNTNKGGPLWLWPVLGYDSLYKTNQGPKRNSRDSIDDRISFSRNPIPTSSHPLQVFARGSRVARSLTCLTVFSVYEEGMLCVGVTGCCVDGTGVSAEERPGDSSS